MECCDDNGDSDSFAHSFIHTFTLMRINHSLKSHYQPYDYLTLTVNFQHMTRVRIKIT